MKLSTTQTYYKIILKGNDQILGDVMFFQLNVFRHFRNIFVALKVGETPGLP